MRLRFSSELLNFDFNSTNICSKIIMNAECLKVAFSELDMTSDLLEILISPEDPYFRLSTFGISGSSTQDFPQDSDMIEGGLIGLTNFRMYMSFGQSFMLR